ncbi:glutathione peroxidase [Litorivivens lipolytica]|uniref:Glutathione peroxidase n=1 Tax=Litorivivens lipolytica TaxID=1524264 RepID=A0A7W4W595_9GAMM|nr:glutathione peroxidase [Litorivivens lipolytica]MBB3047595.1 glutathione peroxidase [Litorivivens lipolytica]
MRFLLLLLLTLPFFAQADVCSPLLDYRHTALRSSETVDFCERFRGKVLLVVNTASQCGFTPQFEGLERLYQDYRERGLEIVGFPSNDFRQEYSEAAETAKVCYVNYGVTFTMLEASSVRGSAANALFARLEESGAGQPRWNFYKYLIDRDGRVVTSFPSRVEPESPAMRTAIEGLLGN